MSVIIGNSGARPLYFISGSPVDTRTSRDSSPITASQSGTTVISSLPLFTVDDIGQVLKFFTGQTATVVSFSSSTQVGVDVSPSVASTTVLVQGHTFGGNFGDCLAINSTGTIIVGYESDFGDADQLGFWYNRNTGEYRSLGADFTPVRVNIDGGTAGFTGLNIGNYYDPLTNSFSLILPGGTVGTPQDMNEAKQFAVDYTASHDDMTTWPTAGFAQGGALTTIRPTETAKSGAPNNNDDGWSGTYAINASGHVFGWYEDPNDDSNQKLFFYNGAIIAIPTPSGAFAEGGQGHNSLSVGLNDSDYVCGDYDGTPFIWHPTFGFTFIPMLSGASAGFPRAINNAGWVVGEMVISGNDTAFLYRSGVTVSILSLAAAIDPLWTDMIRAHVVNNNKQIVGVGIHDGSLTKYRLTLT